MDEDANIEQGPPRAVRLGTAGPAFAKCRISRSKDCVISEIRGYY